MQEKINDIVTNGARYNLDWLNGPAREDDHYLYHTYLSMHGKSVTFAKTCCEVTAAMIRWKMDTPDCWILVNGKPDSLDIYQVTVGESWDDVDHIFTVYNNSSIIESMYNKYMISINPISKSFGDCVHFWVPPLTIKLDLLGEAIYTAINENIDREKWRKKITWKRFLTYFTRRYFPNECVRNISTRLYEILKIKKEDMTLILTAKEWMNRCSWEKM
jgi:hypothetical protein